MDVLQGRYFKEIKSKNGRLKGLKIKTADGTQTIYLPKPLREIAQEELALGDSVRVWSTAGKKEGKSQSKKRYATGLIPLSPKTKLKLNQIGTEDAKLDKTKSEQTMAKKTKSKQNKSKKKTKKTAGKPVTVQLCQKKNCCKKGGSLLWQKFEQQQVESASSKSPFKLEAVGCLGGCKRGPNIRFLPNNVKHYHVQPGDVTKLLKKYQS
ncbi:MAG: (2Fe-2S) ferredoxin domain-containing protein [Cyanobacteria bacterium J06621_11]